MNSTPQELISDETIDLFIQKQNDNDDQAKADELKVSLEYYRMEFV